eukprot:TRINITY_DN5306_c0_g3_i2.p1 TRINITY_DN5306_c0_g3~~TRINITY_DN5306_c0_g3_i2.p1  ORF type:complete len:324 (+),score=81.54 TRINITY_DN5306_c0_g3_i2:214-1185(+)
MNEFSPSRESIEMNEIGGERNISSKRQLKKELFSSFNLFFLYEDPSSPYFGINLLGTFSELPLEILEYILSYLDYKELCNVGRLNWWFNIRAESNSFWKELFRQSFKYITPSNVTNAESKGWKYEFMDTLAWEDEWNPDKRSRQLRVTNGRQIMIERGYEWSTCQIGKRCVNEYEKRSWTFRVLGSVGLMIGLVEEGWDFVDSYPGTGYYGCTFKAPPPKETQDESTSIKRPNHHLFSLAYYEVFDRFDKIVMEVSTKEKVTKFYRNDKLFGSINFEVAQDKRLVPICALCGPSSSIEIIPSVSIPQLFFFFFKPNSHSLPSS